MESETVTPNPVEWLKWLDWLAKNKRRVALWGGAVVVVLLGVALIVYEQKQKEVRASEALANVDLPIPPGKAPAPNTAEELLKVEQNHPNTRAATRALLEAGTVRFVEGRYADAEALFSRFEKDYPESLWLPQALLGRAAALEAQNKSAEALTEYERLKKIYPSDAIATEVQMGLARMYEQQSKPEDALKIYEDILQANHPSYSSVGAQAAMRQDAILKKHPELAKTNAPPIISPPTPMPTASNATVVRPSTNQPIAITLTNLLKATNAPAPVAGLTNAAATNRIVLPSPSAPKTNAAPPAPQ
jgi:tetratricopeptide (TPR) repeat protein